MTQHNLPKTLATHDGLGYVVAPAGHGKTHLIAESVESSTGRQLILTHTHAGVSALRKKLREHGIRPKQTHVDTIASWVLRICLSYSQTSQWSHERPTGRQWQRLYPACIDLLQNQFMRRIVRASYTRVLVDEYQDCNTAQHEIIDALARDLPCCVLGDPMQAIFNFGGQKLIDWDRDITPKFRRLGELNKPYRWSRSGADDLGCWLIQIRNALEQGSAINLNQDRPECVKFIQTNETELHQQQTDVCRKFSCDDDESVIAILGGSFNFQCHNLAQKIGGRFTSIEEIEGKCVFDFIQKLEAAEGSNRKLIRGIELASKCMIRVRKNLSKSVKRGEFTKLRANTINRKVAELANHYLDDASGSTLASFLVGLSQTDDVKIYRADLLSRVISILEKHASQPEQTIVETANKNQAEFRRRGRPLRRKKIISTTLLVKGQEYDHGIVLDANSLNAKELYVALTRGAKSLTILSRSDILSPRE